MIDALTGQISFALLVFARVFAFTQVAPLLSSSGVPQAARAGLALFVTAIVAPWLAEIGWVVPQIGVLYALALVGEALIGIILGFFVDALFASFQVAGQFFSLQMGFGAAQVFDPLAQVQVPLLGQLFSLMAMFIFLTIGGFQKYVIVGFYDSFRAISAVDLAFGIDRIGEFFIGALSGLFETAFTLSLPILGTLLLGSVSIGLLAKAAPQMNLLMLGFPISIGVGFAVFIMTLPFILEGVAHAIDNGFLQLQNLLDDLWRAAQ